MKNYTASVLAAILLSGEALGQNIPIPANTVLSRIAFGSCARQMQEAPLYKTIVAAKPDLFLMIGDATNQTGLCTGGGKT